MKVQAGGKDYLNLSLQEIAMMLKMTEGVWQNNYFVPLFKQLGWTGWHVPDSRQMQKYTKASEASNEGVAPPDWMMWRERLMHVELKKEGGSLSENQWKTIDQMRVAGAEVHVWYPHMWRSHIVPFLVATEPKWHLSQRGST